MKTLIMKSGNEYRTWLVNDEADAKYQVQLRVKNEGWEAEQAFIVDHELPAKEWVKEYHLMEMK